MLAPDLAEAARRVAEQARIDHKLDTTRGIETRLQKALATEFRAQGRIMLAGLRDKRSRFPTSTTEGIRRSDWEPIWRRSVRKSSGRMVRALDAAAAAGLRAGAQMAAAELGVDIDFNLKNPRAVRYMRQYGARLVAQVNETTRGYIRSLMTKAVREGWSYQRTARALTERYAEFAIGSPLQHIRSRAELIAVTESAKAYEMGNNIVARDLARSGQRIEKFWFTVGDERVDEEQCGPNEAEGWIGLLEEFPSGHDTPPAHPGCRCTLGYQSVVGR